MSKLILTYLLAIVQLACYAQFTLKGQSETFDELGNGYGKLLTLKNGNTLFFLTDRDGVTIQLFSPDHKPLKKISPTSSVLSGKSVFVKTIFEVNNSLVLLTISSEKELRVVSRVIIDLRSGSVKEEELAKFNTEFKKGHKLPDWLEKEDNVHIKRDAQNDNYIIVIETNQENNFAETLECLWYDNNHKLVAKTAVSIKDKGFDSIEFLDVEIIGNNQWNILLNGINGRKDGKRQLMYGTLKKGETTLGLKSSNLIESFETARNANMHVQSALLKYNSVTGRYILVSNLNNKQNDYLPVISFLNITTGDIESTELAIPESAIQASVALLGQENAFHGLPQDVIIADDGRFSIIFEEHTIAYINGSIRSTHLGNLAVIYFDMLGGARGSYFIPKLQGYTGAALNEFYLNKKKQEPVFLGGANKYVRALYVDGKFSSYIMFNDLEKNGERIKKGKQNIVVTISDCDAFSYRIDGASPILDRKPVFEIAKDKDDHNILIFAGSDYDKSTNTLASMQLEITKRRKYMKIVWLQPL